MRVFFTLTPETGSLHPLLPVAQALDQAGHTVALCSTAEFGAEAVRAGFLFLPAGVDYDFADSAFNAIVPAAASAPPPSVTGGGIWYWRLAHVWAATVAARMGPDEVAVARAWGDAVARAWYAAALLPDVVELARAWRTDLIVRVGFEFSGCAAAEALGLPHASIEAPSLSALDLRHKFAPGLAGLRTAAGLPEDQDMEMPYRYLHLCFMPPGFHGDRAAFPPTAHFLRHTNPPRPGEALPAWVAGLSRQPTVLTSLGTVLYREPGLNEAILAGLRDEPINLIAAVGRDTDPAVFGPQPGNVHIERYLPQTLLLPHCTVFVTHAGFNSVKESLSFGVPMVVLPLTGEQAYTAERCVALGVAERVDMEERTPERIRSAVRRVLNDPAYAERARAMQRDMQTLPGPETAVELLERLAQERLPLLGQT